MQRLKMKGYLVLCASFVAFSAAGHADDEIPTDETWSLHSQATAVPQLHPSFPALYSGALSLSPEYELRTSLTATAFLGRKLWTGGEAYVDPEVSGGSGLSETHGVAGFPNGEIYRVDTPSLKFNLSRLFVRQSFGSGETERLEPDKNQLGITLPTKRFTLTFGKFSLNDFFDNNIYSHDPRTQFLNWALMDNGAWDYAADTRGYTWALGAEYRTPTWSIRGAVAMEPAVANGLDLDTNLAQAHGDNLEIEHRHRIGERPGAIRFLAYMNHARMGSYQEALSRAGSTGTPDVTLTRDYRTKYGLGLNVEQEITADLGAFLRAGWDDGATETWAFTEIDRTLTLGLSSKGEPWGRARDTAGLAWILNGLSKDHADYLAAGGVGFLIGDGKLNYALEQILEFYYSAALLKSLWLSADFQEVWNPAYNQDRGPVSLFALRLHFES